jgi:hypothetical protein
MPDDLYTNRRTRVAIQVCSKWARTDDWTDEQMLTVIAAADMAFRAGITDLDWEAATLHKLKDPLDVDD